MFRNPTTDLIVVLVIVLLVLGPKRLPGLGKGLGQGMRDFKDAIGGHHKDEDEDKPAIPSSSTVSDPVTTSRSDATPTTGSSSEVGSERRS